MNVFLPLCCPLEVSGSKMDAISVFPSAPCEAGGKEGKGGNKNGDPLGQNRAPARLGVQLRLPSTVGGPWSVQEFGAGGGSIWDLCLAS